ncbi:MAG: ABC transporter ATP-binding protein, partial [Acidobacteriaceae bacterium]
MPAAEAQPRKDSAPRSSEPRPPSKPASVQQDDDIVGKAYDSRLMARLITYLFPYKWACIASIAAILLKAGADVLGPYLTMVAVDLYLTPAMASTPPAAAEA